MANGIDWSSLPADQLLVIVAEHTSELRDDVKAIRKEMSDSALSQTQRRANCEQRFCALEETVKQLPQSGNSLTKLLGIGGTGLGVFSVIWYFIGKMERWW